MPRLILASTSRYRRSQLEKLGIPFEAHSSDVDEDLLKAENLPPDELAVRLSVLKAEALATQFPDALLIGGDQIAEIDGEMLNKPETAARAQAQLRLLSGRAHRLWTAMAIHEPASGRTETFLEKHTLHMRALSDEQIARYVEADQPLDSCGSYRIESRGIALFSSIEGHDHTAIVGLPLMRLVTLLGEFGVSAF